MRAGSILRALAAQERRPWQEFRIAGSIIGLHHLRRIREEMAGDVLHVRLFPKGELVMGLQATRAEVRRERGLA
jgi:hypothetical protein